MTNALFARLFPVIGVIHLPPLPGAPRASAGFEEILAFAVSEAGKYRAGGADGVILENYGDAPFPKDRTDPHVPAFLAIAAREVRRCAGGPVGVNCLRNDALGALAAAAAASADFIRVNVLLGVTATDQGLIEGCADRLLRYRRNLGTGVAILADIEVKHGTPLYAPAVGPAAAELFERGGAEAVIVTGSSTGAPPALEELTVVRAAVGDRGPVLIGSGATPECIGALAAGADGVIVGSSCKEGGRAGRPVDPARLAAFAAAVGDVRAGLGRRP